MGGPDFEKLHRGEHEKADAGHANTNSSVDLARDQQRGNAEVQLWAKIGSAPPATREDAAQIAIDRKGAGKQVDGQLAGKVSEQTGVNVSEARVHSDAVSQGAARAMGARAFAHGSDVFLGAGESATDPKLMGHELAHVAQQAGGGAAVQKKPTIGGADSPAEAHADAVGDKVAANAAPDRLLVDEAKASPTQMTKVAFLAQLRGIVVATVEQELGKLGATAGCPYIDRYFTKYGNESANACEDLIRHWIPAAKSAHNATDLFALIQVRVREGVRSWSSTGRLPPDLATLDPGITSEVHGAGKPKEQVHAKSLDAMEAKLGPGEPLDSGTATRMSKIVGADVSRARIHDNSTAHAMAADNQAKAFAVGNNVVMGSSAPRSGIAADVLLAHELTHTAQQSKAADDPRAKAQPIGAEEQAAETDAGTARLSNFGKALGDVMQTGLQLQRCQMGESGPEGINSESYYEQNKKRIAVDAAAQIQDLPFATYDDTVTWGPNGLTVFTHAIAAALSKRVDLDSLVRPEPMGKLLAEARLIRGHTTSYDEATPSLAVGPNAYFPSVGTEIGNALARRVGEALQREIPRYAQARIAAGGQQPAAGMVVGSHPIDPVVIEALSKPGVVAIDTEKFKTKHPELAGPPKLPTTSKDLDLRPVPGKTGWWQLMNADQFPEGVTPEEVAARIANDPLEAFRLDVAPPYYGLADDTNDNSEESTTSQRAVQLAEAADPMTDAVALAQAGTANKSRAAETILEQMRLNANIMGVEVAEAASAFGMRDRIGATAALMAGRAAKLAASSDSEVQKWDAHAQRQAELLARGSQGLAFDQARVEAYKAQLDQGESLPTDHPLIEDARMWVDALVSIDLVNSSDKLMAAAARHSLTLEVEILERGMSTPQQVGFDSDSTPQTRKDFDTDGVAKEEIEDRKKLGKLRAQMLADPTKVNADESKKLTDQASDLIFQSQVVQQAEQLEQGWTALNQISASWMTTSGDAADAKVLADEGHLHYKTWQTIYALIKKGRAGDKPSMDQAKILYQAWVANPLLSSWLERVQQEIKDIQRHQMIVALIVMIGITIVSMGAGSALSGFLGGAVVAGEAGEAVIVGGLGVSRGVAGMAGFMAEVSTFTYLSNRAFSADHSAGAMVSELGKNLIMFGAMKAVMLGVEAAGLTKIFKVGKDASTIAKIAATTGNAVGSAVINSGIGYLTIWVEEKIKRALGSKPMTAAEADQAVFMAIAQAVIFTIGGRLLESPIRKLGVGSGKLAKAMKPVIDSGNVEIQANTALQARLHNLEAAGNAPERAEISAAVQKDRVQIQAEKEALQKLTPEEMAEGKIDAEKLASLENNIHEQERAALALQLSLGSKQVAANHYKMTPENVEAIRSDTIANGGTAESEGKDPVTGAETWKLTPAAAEKRAPFRVTEDVPEWAHTPEGKRVVQTAREKGMRDVEIYKLRAEERAKFEAPSAAQPADAHANNAKATDAHGSDAKANGAKSGERTAADAETPAKKAKYQESKKPWDDPSMTREEFIEDVRARSRGKKKMSDADLGKAYDEGKRRSPSGHLVIPKPKASKTPWNSPDITFEETRDTYRATVSRGGELSDEQIRMKFDAGQRWDPNENKWTSLNPVTVRKTWGERVVDMGAAEETRRKKVETESAKAKLDQDARDEKRKTTTDEKELKKLDDADARAKSVRDKIVTPSPELDGAIEKRQKAGIITDAQANTLKRWSRLFSRLRDAASTLEPDEVLEKAFGPGGPTKENFGQGGYDKFRYRLMDEAVNLALNAQGNPLEALKRFTGEGLSVLPDPASRGSLFSKFRRAFFMKPLGPVQPGEQLGRQMSTVTDARGNDGPKVLGPPEMTGDVHRAGAPKAADPAAQNESSAEAEQEANNLASDKKVKNRYADGVMRLENNDKPPGSKVDPPSELGEYAVDDKAGMSLNEAQLRDVNAKIANGKDGFINVGGSPKKGVIYMCESPENAAALASKMRDMGLSDRMHVALIDPSVPGGLQWYR